MRLLLDEHLSRKLVPLLEWTFPGTTHVILNGLETAADDAIWEFARAGLAAERQRPDGPGS